MPYSMYGNMFSQLAEAGKLANSSFANMPGGADFFKMIMDRMKQGLSAEDRNRLITRGSGAIKGGTRSATEMLKNVYAGRALPIGAITKGFSDVSTNEMGALNNLYTGVEDINQQVKTGAIGNYLQGAGLNADIGFKNQQIQLAKEAGEFDPMQLFGDIIGAGGQVGAGMATGGMCCFIFLEAYNGTLPWWVRECRDEFAPEDSARREGYTAMANWLVPLMKKSCFTRGLVNTLMIKPLTKWGGWHKKVKGYRFSFIYYPFVKFWFGLWRGIGNA